MQWKALKTVVFFALVVVIAGSGLSASCRPKPDSAPINIGMIALLANPEKYDGKIIRTWGFLNLRSDDNGLFLHEEDLKIPLLKNSFQLDLTAEQERSYQSLNHSYVVIEGTLHSAGPTGSTLNSGIIGKVLSIRGWSPFAPVVTNK